MKTDRLGIRVEPELKIKLTEKANAESRSLSNYILHLLRKDVEKK